MLQKLKLVSVDCLHTKEFVSATTPIDSLRSVYLDILKKWVKPLTIQTLLDQNRNHLGVIDPQIELNADEIVTYKNIQLKEIEQNSEALFSASLISKEGNITVPEYFCETDSKTPILFPIIILKDAGFSIVDSSRLTEKDEEEGDITTDLWDYQLGGFTELEQILSLWEDFMIQVSELSECKLTEESLNHLKSNLNKRSRTNIIRTKESV